MPLRVLNLGVSPTAVVLATDATYEYNSGQATVRKNFSKGLLLQAAYTFSNATITAPFGVNYAPYLIEKEENNNGYRPHRLSVSYAWDLPLATPRFVAVPHRGVGADRRHHHPVGRVDDDHRQCRIDLLRRPGAGIPRAVVPRKTNADLLTGGSLTDRVTSGLNGGPGYLNGKAQGVLCAVPAIGNGTGFGNMDGGVVLSPGQNNWDIRWQ